MGRGPVSDLTEEQLSIAEQLLESERQPSVPSTLPGSPVAMASRFITRVRPAAWMVYDAAGAMGALALGFYLTPRGVGLMPAPIILAVFAAALVLGGNATGLYDRQILLSRIRLLVSLGCSTFIALIAVSLFSNLVFYDQIGRWVLLIAATAGVLIGAAPRLVGHYAASLHKMRILLVGDNATSSPVARRLGREESPYVLVGFCGDSGTGSDAALGAIDDMPRVCREEKIDEIVISNGYVSHPDVLYKCLQSVQWGCRVQDEASFCEDVFQEVPVDEIGEGWFYAARLGGGSSFHSILKRLLDIAAAAIGLLLTLPLTAVIWAAVRLTSAGPAIYSQARCGRYGQPFKIYKFRTMRLGAESNGAQWAETRDPRVTGVGRFLRRTRLDEIPQFWNVIIGDMSLVGPRPERPELAAEIEKHVPYFAFRHLVRPGITGLAQIRFNYGSGIQDARKKLQHDLYYIKRWTILVDLHVILRTVTAVMRGSR